MVCCIPQLAGDLLRTFVCVAIPDEHRQRIAEWINERKTVSNEIRWVEPITLHITLKFCGERLPETVKTLAKFMAFMSRATHVLQWPAQTEAFLQRMADPQKPVPVRTAVCNPTARSRNR